MPNRLFRDGYLDSDKLSSLDDWCERVFTRAVIASDDAGRLDGRIEFLCSKLFPTRQVDPSLMSEAIEQLIAVDLLTSWAYGQKKVLQVRKWQRCSPARVSRFPDPDGGFQIVWIKQDTRDGPRDFVNTSLSDAIVQGVTGGAPIRNPSSHLPGFRNPSGRDTGSSDRNVSGDGDGDGDGDDKTPHSPLKRGRRNVRMIPPSLDDWLSYCYDKFPDWPRADAEAAWDHYESVGWRQGSGVGKPIRDWKACGRTCHQRWKNEGSQHSLKKVSASLGALQIREKQLLTEIDDIKRPGGSALSVEPAQGTPEAKELSNLRNQLKKVRDAMAGF